MAPGIHGLVEGPDKSDVELIDELLGETPEWIYRCPNANCAYEGNAAVHVYHDVRKVDECRCPSCNTWISNGVPIVKAERQVLHILPIAEKTRAELEQIGFTAENTVEGEFRDG